MEEKVREPLPAWVTALGVAAVIAIVTLVQLFGMPHGSASIPVPKTYVPFTTTDKSVQGLGPDGSTVYIQSQKMHVSLAEQTKEVESDGARIKFDYKSLGLGDRDDQDFSKEDLKEIEKAATGMSIEMFVTNRGLVRRPKANLTNVPQGYRPILTFFMGCPSGGAAQVA